MKITEMLVHNIGANAAVVISNMAAASRDKNLAYLLFGVDARVLPLLQLICG